MQVYNFRPMQPVSWYRKSKNKSNQFCLYCSKFIGQNSQVESSKEHLIARNFVPSGSMTDTTFNFIFRACVECNSKKAQLERHISSVSMFNSPARAQDMGFDNLASDKASRDFHPDKKGVVVKDAAINISSLIGKKFGAGFVAPPQLNNGYIKELSLMHIQGFYSLITTTDPASPGSTGILEPGRFWLLGAYSESDWGNPQLTEVIFRTKGWACHCNVISANGYFKVILKKGPVPSDFFWALEWNKYIRVVGAISSVSAPPMEFLNLPTPTVHSWRDQSGTVFNATRHTPLRIEDELFSGGGSIGLSFLP